ncbi:MAG: hypothetical protein VKS61_11460 [Candidatus Sericytochromatia bacterium]|nr:hypothetical protein [Candidatus Sericytochromatia bacterium]
MFSQVITDGAYAFLAPERGQHPATALAFVRGVEAWARVALLPRLRVVAAEGLEEEAQQALLGVARLHRDALLEGWVAPAVVAPEAGPRAVGITHDARKRVYTLRLDTGAALRFPQDALEALHGQPDEVLAEVSVSADGEALAWPAGRVFLRVSEVVLGVTGGPGWRDALTTSLLGAQRVAAAAPEAEPGQRAAPAPAAPPRIRSLVGLILHREGMLSPEEAHAIAEGQQAVRRDGRELSFGQVGLELGLLDEEQLRFALLVQDRLSHAPGDTKPLAIFLMESAELLPSQLLKALDEQASTGRDLGDVLVRWKVVSQDLVETFLARSREPRRPARSERDEAPAGPRVTMSEGAPTIDIEAHSEQPAPRRARPGAEANEDDGARNRSLLGLILEREGYLTQAQMKHISAEQARARRAGQSMAFGEMAIKLELLTSEQLRFAANMQKRLAYDPGPNKPLWATILENGVLKPSQVLMAMEDSARTTHDLEDLLVERGFISDGMLAVFRRMHNERS